MWFLKFLVTLFIIYFVFKFIFRILFPFLLKLYINKKFHKFNNRDQFKNKKSSDKFDDFEEIK